MVASVTNFGRSGVYDWMVQRVTAVALAAYTLFLLGFFASTGNVDFVAWKALFSCTSMRIFSLLALTSMAAHAWIGLWTVTTDYLKGAGVRFAFQAVCGLVTFVYVVWGIQILWGL